MTTTYPEADTPLPTSRLDIRPLSGNIGAEIRGVDLKRHSTPTPYADDPRTLAAVQGRVLPGPTPDPRRASRVHARSSANSRRPTR